MKHRKPTRNYAYLSWLRGLPCWACEQSHSGASSSPVEAAHVGLSTSRRGLGQKYPDIEAIPLCGMEHHRDGAGSIHRLGPDKFFTRFGSDRDSIIRMFQRAWKESDGTGVSDEDVDRIIESGFSVPQLLDQPAKG